MVKATRKTRKLELHLKKKGIFLREEISSFVENRKRFMTKLPKIKYGDIHDKLYRLLHQPDVIEHIQDIIFPLYLRAVKIVANIKAVTKKAFFVK